MKMLSKLWVLGLILGLCCTALFSNAQASMLACDFTGNLYSVNTSNANLTLIGNTGITDLGDITFGSNGTLYGVSAGGGILYSIDPNTAASSSIGSLGISFLFEGGLAFSPGGTLYGVNGNSNATPFLETINPITGAATDVGQMGTNHDINGITWRSDGMLVGVDDNTSSLVIIDPTTAALSNLLNLGFSTSDVGGMTTDGLSGISYFATGSGPDVNSIPGTHSLYSFDPFSGANVLIGSLADNAGLVQNISGIAASTVPEPGTLGLLGIGLIGLALIRRKS